MGSGNRRFNPTISINHELEIFMKMQLKMRTSAIILGLLASIGAAKAEGVIKIGEINSYKAFPAF